MLSGKDADGFSAIALAIFTRRSVRRRSPNSAVPNVSTAHFSGCSSPAMSICLTPFVYIVSPSSLPEFVLTCQTDSPIRFPAERPKDWADLAPGLGPQPSDHLVTKRQWGAFFGTDL